MADASYPADRVRSSDRNGAGQAASAVDACEIMMMDRAPLDRHRFDALLAGPEMLWGLEVIAKVLGVSVSTARRWAGQDGVPIYRPVGVGSHFAFRTELVTWLRAKS